MDTRLSYLFFKNFIYSGVILGVLLSLMEIIKNSKKNIGFYAFLSGSFFVVNLIQYNYIEDVSHNNTETFLFHSITGGILWVVFSIFLYILYKYKIDKTLSILIMIFLVLITTLLYYYFFLNN
tara:strand:+ start:1000 stop:1368 length:369 start_codon:yes stop_codon:yes gene_type:complete